MKDPRYHGTRWRKTALAVLARDMRICRVIEGCPRPAKAADHINPVYPGMPDHEFYAMANLRAACRPHNLRRGHVEQFERELAEGMGTGSVPNVLQARGPFLGGQRLNDRPLVVSLSPFRRTVRQNPRSLRNAAG